MPLPKFSRKYMALRCNALQHTAAHCNTRILILREPANLLCHNVLMPMLASVHATVMPQEKDPAQHCERFTI